MSKCIVAVCPSVSAVDMDVDETDSPPTDQQEDSGGFVVLHISACR